MSIESRRAALAARLDVWLARGSRRAFNRTPVAKSAAPRLAAPGRLAPSPLGRGTFPKHLEAEETWLRVPPLDGHRIFVPPLLISLNADPAWRRTEVP